ncbi:MAG: hypothetical protein WCX70_00510 [Candidatus Paceibacterota bacterium]|jgi:hypothetical protein
MSNLLPERNKEEIHVKFFYRKLTIIVVTISVLIFISSVLLLSIYIYLYFGGIGNKEETKILSELSIVDQELVNMAQDLNKKMNILLPKNDAILPSVVIASLLEPKGEGLTIHHLAFECQSLNKVCIAAVLGQTRDRQTLLDYVSVLRKNKFFKSVESPINNLISDKDSQFNLELETNPIREF